MAKFQYEHPDLVREGITWTGKPGYIHPVPEPDPVRPDPVAEVQERQQPSLIATALDRMSFQPIPGWIRKECKSCGKEFWAKYNTKKYCSEDCYKVGNRKNSHTRYVAEHPETQEQRYCVICGKPLPLGTNRTQITCGSQECRHERNMQTKRESNRRARERRKMQ